MGLRGQFAQGHFCTFHGLALGAESRIAQTRSAFFTEIAAFTSVASGTPVSETVTTALTRCSRAALSRTAVSATTIASGGRLCFLLARAVIATHSNHRLGGFGYHQRGCGLGFLHGGIS